VDYTSKITREELKDYALDYISKQRCYFKSIHICKEFIKKELKLSHHSKVYDKLYRSLISRFSFIINEFRKNTGEIESLGKGLYRKVIT